MPALCGHFFFGSMPLHLLHVLDLSVPVMGGEEVRDEMIAIARQEKQLLLEQTVHEALGDLAPFPIHITDQHILQDLPDQDGLIRLMWYCHTREVFLFDRDRPHTKQVLRREHAHAE